MLRNADVGGVSHLTGGDVMRRLSTVDWNFSDADRAHPIHAIHPYPARFIPQIPKSLIDLLYPNDGSVVLDPFCGSGTTLVEATRAGIPAVGVDLHPLAVLVSKVKTASSPSTISTLAKRIVDDAKRATEPLQLPNIPRLDHWFQPNVQQALTRLTTLIHERDGDARNALSVALSSIIVKVSNQESDTRYAAIDKSINDEAVYEHFVRAARLIDAARGVDALFTESTSTVRLLQSDILDVEPRDIGVGTVGLVITSPPYPNAYEYWLYHKYRMYWLGMDPIGVRSAEIGARPKYHGSNPEDETDFEAQMERVFGLIATVMHDRGVACFVVGRSIIRGRVIDNAALLQRAAAQHGLHRVGIIARKIPRTRKSFNPVHGSIEEEQLVVFSKTAGSS